MRAGTSYFSLFIKYKIRYKIKIFYRTGIWIILLLCIALKNRVFRQCLHRMAFQNTNSEPFFAFLAKTHFLCFKWPRTSHIDTSLFQSLWLFQFDKNTSIPWTFPSCFLESWWQWWVGGEVGWEGWRADGSERHDQNLRLKLMCFHPSFLLHRILFSFSSRFAIRMTVLIFVCGVWCTGTALHTDHRQHKWKSLSMRNINIVICGKFE